MGALSRMNKVSRIPVDLGERSHDVLVGSGALGEAARELASIAKGRKIALIADEHVWSLQRERVERAFEVAGLDWLMFPLPEGEEAKSFGVIETLCRALAEKEIERGDVIVGLGGGAATDAAGFIAAIFLRGVSYVAMPTSLLSQVDAAVGGKTGINLPEGKNLVGAFYSPRLVACETDFLSTLPERERNAGLAEMVKMAWIRDPEMFHRFEKGPVDAADLPALIARCIEHKVEIVEHDERERDERMLLNFGHTWGHAIETESKGALLHGEAVALGMVCSVFHSVMTNRCRREDLDRLVRVLETHGLPTSRREINPDAVAARTRADKKRRGGKGLVVLTEGIGSVSVASNLTFEEMRGALEFLRREGAA
jgi:3-dehydroquinate synthase